MTNLPECLQKFATVTTVHPMTTPSLSEIAKKLPTIDLPKVNLPKVDLPKFDLPKFDASRLPKLPKLDLGALHSIDLTHMDIRKVNTDAVLNNPVVKQATDLGYTAVGFAVLGLQKIQVRRRELLSQLTARRNTAQ